MNQYNKISKYLNAIIVYIAILQCYNKFYLLQLKFTVLKTVKTIRKKIYGFKNQNRTQKIYGFQNRKQKNLRF